MLHISTSALKTVVEICFFNIFAQKKAKKGREQENRGKIKQKIFHFLACTQMLVKDFIPRKSTFSVVKTRCTTNAGRNMIFQHFLRKKAE